MLFGLAAFLDVIIVPRTIIALGKVNSWWSPFRTLPPPGEMYIIVRGAPNGPFETIIESVLNYNYNRETQEFVGSVKKEQEEERYFSNLGVKWVGFWRYLFYREVRHDKWEKLPNSANWGLVSKIRPGPSIFFRYNMAVEIKAAETIGNFPVDAVIVFTAQIINPVKAFFFAGGWETQTTAAVTGCFRKYVSDLTIDQLRVEQRESKEGVSSLVEQIKSLGGKKKTLDEIDNPKGLYALFGVEIIDARFVLFDLVTGDSAMTSAVRAEQIAELEAKADIKRGEGEKQRRTAAAIGIRATVEAWGSNQVGASVAMAEAIKEAKPKVLGGNIIVGIEADKT